MPTIEQGQTTDATPLTLHSVTLGAEAGMVQKYIHWLAYSSRDVCAAGEALLVWTKDASGPPVVKLSSSTANITGYAAPLGVSAAVSGNDCQVQVTGIATTTIAWSLSIETDQQTQ